MTVRSDDHYSRSTTALVDTLSGKAGRRIRLHSSAEKRLALATAEALRVHRLVTRLNAVIKEAVRIGVGINVTVAGGSPDSTATLEVRTTYDSTTTPEAAADALVVFNPTSKVRNGGLE